MSVLGELLTEVLKETVSEGTLRSPAFRYVVGSVGGLLGLILIVAALVQTPLTPNDPSGRRAMFWVGVAFVTAGSVLILWARHSQKA